MKRPRDRQIVEIARADELAHLEVPERPAVREHEAHVPPRTVLQFEFIHTEKRFDFVGEEDRKMWKKKKCHKMHASAGSMDFSHQSAEFELDDEGEVVVKMEHPNLLDFHLPLHQAEEAMEEMAPANRPSPEVVRFMQAPAPKSAPVIDWGRIATALCLSKLKPYQRDAVIKAIREHCSRSLIAVEQGLGKTIIACLLIAFLRGKVLIVGPGGKRGDWVEELMKWTGLVMQDLKTGKTAVTGDIVYTSFDMAKMHAEILGTEWDVIVVDESHKLKEEDTIRIQKLMPIMKRVKSLFLLSGTPQTSRPAELFTQLSMLHPDVFPDRDAFLDRYCDRKQTASGKWRSVGRKHGMELHLIMKRVMIRIKREDALPDLPALTRKLVKFKASRVKAVRDDTNALRVEMKTFRDIIKQLSENPSKYQARTLELQLQQQANLLRKTTGELKTKVCKEWILEDMKTNHPGEKAIVFGKYLEVVAEVAQFARNQGMEVVEITGSKVAPAKRIKLLATMKSRATLAEGPRLAVLSLGSCAEGLNCEGASVMYMLEHDNTVAQAECRILRVGTEIPVTVKYLFLDDSYDVNSLQTLVNRSQGNNLILDGEDEPTLVFHETAYAYAEDARAAGELLPGEEEDDEEVVRVPKPRDERGVLAAPVPDDDDDEPVVKRGRYTSDYISS